MVPCVRYEIGLCDTEKHWVACPVSVPKTDALSAELYALNDWGEWRDLNPRSPGPQPGALDHWATLTISSISII